MKFHLSLLVSLSIFSTGSCLRCFTCRSDAQFQCDDPFFPQNIPVDECNNIHTFESYLCYKAQHYVRGKYITIRGCAPFDNEIFEPRIQRIMKGDYWGYYGNLISFCDTDNCNGARGLSQISTVATALIFFITLLLK